MKIGKWARLLLLGAPFLTGCAGFWQAPASGSGSNSTSTLSSGVFYVLNQTTAQIAAYYMSSGTLETVSGSPYSLGAQPYTIAMAPSGDFLYVSTISGIYLYAVGTGGVLQIQSSGQAINGEIDVEAMAVAFDKTTSNAWLFIASPTNGLQALAINSSTGALTSTNNPPAVSISAANQMAISPDNKFVFLTEGTFGTLYVPLNTSTTSGDPFQNSGFIVKVAGSTSASSAQSVAFDPITTTNTTPRLFYIGEIATSNGTTNTGGLRAFNYAALLNNDTTVSEISGSPFASGGLAPYSILPISSGDYVYVANRAVSNSSTGNITAFAVTASGSTYTLTAQSNTTATGTYPTSLAEDSTGNYVLLANLGGGYDLQGYNFDSTTVGKLDSVLTTATGTDPVGAVQVVALP